MVEEEVYSLVRYKGVFCVCVVLTMVQVDTTTSHVYCTITLIFMQVPLNEYDFTGQKLCNVQSQVRESSGD